MGCAACSSQQFIAHELFLPGRVNSRAHILPISLPGHLCFVPSTHDGLCLRSCSPWRGLCLALGSFLTLVPDSCLLLQPAKLAEAFKYFVQGMGYSEYGAFQQGFFQWGQIRGWKMPCPEPVAVDVLPPALVLCKEQACGGHMAMQGPCLSLLGFSCHHCVCLSPSLGWKFSHTRDSLRCR